MHAMKLAIFSLNRIIHWVFVVHSMHLVCEYMCTYMHKASVSCVVLLPGVLLGSLARLDSVYNVILKQHKIKCTHTSISNDGHFAEAYKLKADVYLIQYV